MGVWRKALRAFWRRCSAFCLLGLCGAMLLFALFRTPVLSGAADRNVAAVSAGLVSYPGETIALRPYLPDEVVWHETLRLYGPHMGLDVACAVCTALADGVVDDVSEERLWGVCVSIASDAGRFVYRSLSSAYVSAGDVVSRGDILGDAGCAPCEAELPPHVHIEWTDAEGRPGDPMRLIDVP